MRLSPTSGVAGVAHRALMAGSLARLARSRGPSAGALAAALRATSLGRAAPEERSWAERIEARRRRLASGEAFAEISPPGGAPDARLGSRQAMEDMSTGSGWISIPPVWGRFVLTLVRELAARSCVELGTGFGVSAAYQGAALELNGAGRLVTLEASAESVAVAERGLSELGLDDRVEVRPGPIADTLEDVLRRAAPVEYALVDAEHTEEGTLRHFDTMLPYLADQAVVLFDDINWTGEMKRAWRAISRHDRVGVALGVGRVGIAVVR